MYYIIRIQKYREVFMPVDFIHTIGLTSTQKTKNGNNYNKSNYGKFAGTAVGLGYGTHMLYKYSKMKKDPQFFETVINVSKDTINNLVENFGDIKITQEELDNEIPKFMKKFVNRGMFALAATIVAVGLGIGAIGDSIANHFIKKNADKKVA